MQAFKVRNIIICSAMMIAAGLAIWMKPTHRAANQGSKVDLEAAIPKEFSGWRMDSSKVTTQVNPEVQATLDKLYDQMLSRTYINKQGHRIMLLIAYGSKQTQELKTHRQEVCYAAQGFKIFNLVHEPISILDQSVPATRMFAVMGERTEPVTYWFTMGNQVVLSRTERLVVQLKYAVAGVIPDGFLIRVSNINPNEKEAYAEHAEFLNKLMNTVDKRTVAKLLGVK